MSIVSAQASEVNGPSVETVNFFEQPHVVDMVERDLQAMALKVVYASAQITSRGQRDKRS